VSDHDLFARALSNAHSRGARSTSDLERGITAVHKVGSTAKDERKEGGLLRLGLDRIFARLCSSHRSRGIGGVVVVVAVGLVATVAVVAGAGAAVGRAVCAWENGRGCSR